MHLSSLAPTRNTCCTSFSRCILPTPMSLKFKSILQSQPLLVFITQVQRSSIFQSVALCTCTSLVFALQLRPLDADFRIVPSHAALIVRMPEVVDFVAKLCFITQNQESMRKTFRDEKLLLVLGRQGNTIPLAVGRQNRF